MKRALITAVSGVCLITVCVGLAMPSHNLVSSRPLEASRSLMVDTTAYLRTIGLPADMLLAAGFSAEQVLTAGQNLAQNAGQVDTFTTLRGQVEQLQQQRAELVANKEADLTQAIQELDAQLAPLRTQLESSRTAVRGLVLTGATSEQLQALERVKTGVRHGLPLHLAVAAENDQVGVKLAVALKAEARASRTGEQLEQGAASLLSTARARADVLAGQTNSANCPTVNEALRQTVVP